jgi:hypothetical protein
MKRTFPSYSRTAAIFVLALFVAGCARENQKGTSEVYSDQRLKKISQADQGVVLAFQKGTTPSDSRVNDIGIRESIIVRVRNLDGWVIDKLIDNRITGDPAMTVGQRNDYATLLRLVEAENAARREKGLNLVGADAFLSIHEAVKPPVKRGTDAPDGTAAAPQPTAAEPVSANLPLIPLTPPVTVEKLRQAQNAYRALDNYVKRQLFLVINNSQLREIKAENPDAGVVSKSVGAKAGDTIHEFEFRLRRRAGDEAAWDNLYDGTRGVHLVRVSVGVLLDNQAFILPTGVHPQAETKAQIVELRLYRDWWLWGVTIGLLLLLAGLVVLGATTALFRDTDLPLRADGCPQFSLSRVQLAFWTYLVIGAFLIIWLVTDRLDTLNTTILGLLGISSGTTFASKLANALTLQGGAMQREPLRGLRRRIPEAELRTKLQSEQDELEQKVAKYEQRSALSAAADQAQGAHLATGIQRVEEDLEYLGHHRITRFFVDLLSENNRVTLHRLQIIVWTLVLGVVFVAKVKRELSMPVFSDTLLGLMGLSSITYIALKVPELKKMQAEIDTASKPPK